MNDEVSRDSIEQFLTGIGWRSDRRVGTEAAIAAWVERGYTPHEAALSFVEQFDGIIFQYPRHPVVGGFHSCALDAVRATNALSPITVRKYEERAGKLLCPVGIAASNHLTLMVSTSAAVFAGYDRFLAMYGNDGATALWNLFHNIDPVRLPEL